HRCDRRIHDRRTRAARSLPAAYGRAALPAHALRRITDPAWFPGDAVSWTYVAGVALIVFGAGLLAPATAPLSALLAGCMVFSWFWIVHLPRTLVSMSDGVAIFEALAVSGIGFLLAGSLRQSSPAATTTPE